GDQSVTAGEKTKKKEDVMASATAKRILQHWENFNFKGNAVASRREEAEQKLVDFIALFPTVPDTVSQVAVKNMLTEASADPEVLDYFLKQYEHYLYDPNSPMRNEAYYEKVL